MKKTACKLAIFTLVLIIIISLFALCSCYEEREPFIVVKMDYPYTVYEGDDLDSLRKYLKVNYFNNHGWSQFVDDYTIQGKLEHGNVFITVQYNGLEDDIQIWVDKKGSDIPESEFYVFFTVNGATLSMQRFTASNKDITEPPVPEKKGYIGAWESYELAYSDVKVNAVYTAKQYSVSLDYDGATEGNIQQTITAIYDEAVGDLPVPQKSGHIFTGWYLGDTEVDQSTFWTTDSSASTLTAHWKDLSVPTVGLKYTLNYDGKGYTLSGMGEATDTVVVIPSTYNDKPVTSIGNNAFLYGSNVTDVIIPDSVTYISSGAFFACKKLKSVVIPNSVTTISSQAFAYCNELISAPIPDSVTYIGNDAFDACGKLTSLRIPKDVAFIGEDAFKACGSFTSIVVEEGNAAYHSEGNCLIETESKRLLRGCKNSVIPTDGSVTSIHSSAFDECKGLASVIIPNSVTSIGYNAFAYCTDLTSVKLPDGITTIESFTFEHCMRLASITIPDNVTSIGWRAFYNCGSLIEVVIPDSIESVNRDAFGLCNNLKYNRLNNVNYLGNSENPYLVAVIAENTSITSCEISSDTKVIADNAFYGCKNLTGITIPESVICVGDSAFNGCSGLASIVVEEGNTLYHSAGNCLIETASKTLLVGCKNSVIPTAGSVTKIGVCAFYGCSDITSIIIPECVTSIDWGAFYGCKSLTSITIGGGVKSISGAAFYGSGLTSIVIPDNVTSIGESAFSDCNSLTSVTIGKNVTSIGSWAFTRCENLVNIVVDEENTVYHSAGNCLIETASKTLLRGGQSSVIPTDGSVTSIDNSAFAGCSSMTSIIIPDGITEIGAWAFNDCYGLTSVVIPSSVTYIVNSAFYGCMGLTSIEFDGTVEQWNNVYKGAGWNQFVPANKVTCSNGDVYFR